MNVGTPAILKRMGADLRGRWAALAWTDVIYKLAAFVLLTPLVSVLFRVLLAFAGQTVLADQDILFFFLGPVGWICGIVVGAAWLGIMALEQAALMAVLADRRGPRRGQVIAALRFAAARAWPVLRLTARLTGCVLPAVAPFLVLAGIAYVTLLGRHDINYYLREKPPEFLVAAGIGAVLAGAFCAVLLRLVTGWFFVLPLILWERVEPQRALGVSRERARGHRVQILGWIAGWALASLLLSAAASAIVIAGARFAVPLVTGSLTLLCLAVGISLVLWAAANLAVSLLSTIGFAAILCRLYRESICPGELDAAQWNSAESAAEASGFPITRTRLLAGAFVGVLAALAVGTITLRTVRLEDRVTIMAHRGSSRAAPENTLAAVRQAIEDQADWVEIDVQETADGHVVVFHDSDFMKLAGVDRKIWDVTLADLQDIDIGSRFAQEFSNERVPTLDQVLDLCQGRIGVNIELKYYGQQQQLEQRVAEVVEARQMASEVMLMSLKLDAVQKLKSLRPDWTVGLLLSVAAGDLQKSGADFLAINASFATRSFIRSAHQQGQKVYVWTVNDAPTMSTMIGRGVDGLITDRPALARWVLAQRAELSPLERLLLELAGYLGVRSEIAEL